MKRFLSLAASFALIAMLAGPLTGCAYLHTQRPMSVEFNKTELGTREGRASSYEVMWLVGWGNSGTRAAAENGQIKTIEFADTEILSVLFGLYSRVTTVVYGN